MKLALMFLCFFSFSFSFLVSAESFNIYGNEKLDVSRNDINAHGGGVIYSKGVYYWYGEYRDGALTQKVSLYKSTNMKDWSYCGIILDVSKKHPDFNIERPKIIYNKKSKKFVMWFHQEIKNNFNIASAGVAQSSTINGPFTLLKTFRPNANAKSFNLIERSDGSEDEKKANNIYLRDFTKGQMFRDMSLFVDDDERAYVIYTSEDNYTLHISLLNDDYTNVTDKYIRVMIGKKSEAPTLFKRKGLYYIIASGLHGYAPTITKLAISNSIFGKWKEFPTPFKSERLDMVRNSFYSQTSFVFKIPGKDKYLYMADRWKRGALNKSTYIWLPITWKDSMPEIYWH